MVIEMTNLDNYLYSHFSSIGYGRKSHVLIFKNIDLYTY